jgi:hypothetical protein
MANMKIWRRRLRTSSKREMDLLGRDACLLLQPLQFLSDFILPCHEFLEREWSSPGKMRSVLGMFSAGKPIQQ